MGNGTITIEGLEVRCNIGVSARERKVPQSLFVDIIMRVDIDRAVKSDRVSDTGNYREVCDWIKKFVENSEYHLVESLAESLAAGILKAFNVTEVTLSINKPEAVPEAKTAGITISRSDESDSLSP